MSTVTAPSRTAKGRAGAGTRGRARAKGATEYPGGGGIGAIAVTGLKWAGGTIAVYLLLGLVLLFLLENQPASFIYVSF